MTKYIIEGDINFYAELYKSLDNNEPEKDSAICLITHTPLTKNFVTMECKHTFNYVPLYHDILNHKKKFNVLERQVLKTTEIRCPYCRHVQEQLLPYYEEEGVKKVHGVNFFDESMVIKRCGDQQYYVVGECCAKLNGGVDKCQNTRVALIPENNKYYCAYHKYYGQKEATKELKIKHAQELKKKMMEAKQKLADEKAAAKDEAKQKKILAKKTAKEAAKETAKEVAKGASTQKKNEAIDQPIITCSQILKTGSNKGNPCGQSHFQNNLCKRHYNLSNK